MRLLFLAGSLLLATLPPAQAATAYVFAAPAEAAAMLTARDDFVARLSPFDRAARLKTSRAVSEKDYLDFVGRSVLPWSDADRDRVNAALKLIGPKLAELRLPLPPSVYFIKTSGQEEGQAEYTRGDAIILPQAFFSARDKDPPAIIAHELFHILSRRNPELRERLYRVIGFEPCAEVQFPAALARRKITNPDAPRNDHHIRIHARGKPRWAVPVLFADRDAYDPARGGEFFDYMQFKLLLEPDAATAAADDSLVEVSEVGGYFEQVGKNTGYIIHPEEILADNFAQIVTGKRARASPQIHAGLLKVLMAPAGRP